ncbi:hypothetical protein PSYMO_38573, partial [Pseudomonas amygdali pv. mori str. 301020]
HHSPLRSAVWEFERAPDHLFRTILEDFETPVE